MRDFLLTSLSILVPGIIIAYFSYQFNKSLQRAGEKWDVRRHKINRIESLGARLRELTIAYWGRDATEENAEDIKSLAYELAAYSNIYIDSLYRHLPDSQQDIVTLGKTLTSDEFGEYRRLADPEKLQTILAETHKIESQLWP